MSVFRCSLLVFGYALILCLSSQPAFAKEPFSAKKIRKDIKVTLAKYTQHKPGELNPEKTPGVSVSVVYYGSKKNPMDGKKINVVSGYSNPQTDCNPRPCPRPMNAQMLFELGSITKSATAALILHFIGEGVQLNNHPFTLDSTLESLQPALAGGAFNPKATVRQLLNMTSGIKDFDEDIDYLIIADPEEALERLEAANNHEMMKHVKKRMAHFRNKHGPQLRRFGPYHVPTGRPMENESPARFWTPSDVYNIVDEPEHEGHAWDYSSTNYVICGQYIQGLFNFANLGRAYHQILFRPHRIHLFLGGYDPIGPRPITVGWSSSGVNIKSQSRIAFLSSYGAGGGLLGTAENAARLALTIWSPDILFLKPENLKEMVTGVPCPDLYELVAGEPVPGIEVTAYGLGTSLVNVTLDDKDQRIVKLVGNNGRTRGFHTAAFYLQERQVAFAVLANSGRNHVTGKHAIEIERDIARILMKYDRP